MNVPPFVGKISIRNVASNWRRTLPPSVFRWTKIPPTETGSYMIIGWRTYVLTCQRLYNLILTRSAGEFIHQIDKGGTPSDARTHVASQFCLEKNTNLVHEVVLDVRIGHELVNRAFWIIKLSHKSVLIITTTSNFFLQITPYIFVSSNY
jgi:hypothetical protein